MSMTTVVGNVGEPNLKFTPGGKAVLEFSLAENHWKKEGNEFKEDGTTWRKVSLWEKKAEVASEALKKGDKVIVIGQERLREWEDKQGQKGKTLEMRAYEIAIVPRDKNAGNYDNRKADSRAVDNDPWGNGPDTDPPF